MNAPALTIDRLGMREDRRLQKRIIRMVLGIPHREVFEDFDFCAARVVGKGLARLIAGEVKDRGIASTGLDRHVEPMLGMEAANRTADAAARTIPRLQKLDWDFLARS